MERKSQGACRGKWRYSDAAEYTGRAVYEISPAGEERTWDSVPSNSAAGEITCTPANRVCRLYKIAWCRCIASAAVQPRRLVVHSTKSPAGAVQSAQWRELDLSSSRAPAESPVVICCSRRLSELRSSSLSGGTADGEKEHEGCAPSYSAAGESHLHLGKPSLPSFPDS